MFAALKRSTSEDMQVRSASERLLWGEGGDEPSFGLQALQAETATLSREAARWREHHAHVKQQLEKKERQLEVIEESSSVTAADQDSRTRQLSELTLQLQQRLSNVQGELSAEQQHVEGVRRLPQCDIAPSFGDNVPCPRAAREAPMD